MCRRSVLFFPDFFPSHLTEKKKSNSSPRPTATTVHDECATVAAEPSRIDLHARAAPPSHRPGHDGFQARAHRWARPTVELLDAVPGGHECHGAAAAAVTKGPLLH